MLNYIKAELFKATRRMYLYILTSLIVGGCVILLILLGMSAVEGSFNGASREAALMFLLMFLVGGLYMAPFISDIVFSDQFKLSTIKNEVAFGHSRTAIYLGKLFAALIVDVGVLSVIVGVYLCGAFLFLPDKGMAWQVLPSVWRSLLGALPLWLGGLGVMMCLHFNFKSSNIAEILYFVFLLATSGGFTVLAWLVSDRFYTVRDLLLDVPFWTLSSGTADWAFVGRCWAIGFCWLAASTIAAVLLFRKRDLS